eukprot:TRINITY_DN1097_c0_g1_i8.p1 TRINITY_DN1097_c0_g1~~TRINITY_DN1097_c0_g1_i8.p1  ORF type:complete len:297 (+),score=36.78 TRINITY_DN1097_c0_g1_i8:39-893(+)
MMDSRRSVSVSMKMGVSSHAARRRRQIQNCLTHPVGCSVEEAAVIGALMEGLGPDMVLAAGIRRFRCIRWEALAKRPEIIIGGAPLDGCGPAPKTLYSLSESCQLGDCDVFLSHSWHDCSVLKWEALTWWCEEFKEANGRFPRLWLDKVCVDQNNIEEDLQCLPIFLAGCNLMLVLSGATYHTRLWCCAEMLIYRAMLVADPARSDPAIWSLGKTESECDANQQKWSAFCVDDCDCFKQSDKRRFLKVVGSYPGGAEGFNRFIRDNAGNFTRHFTSDYEVHLDI